MANKKRMFKLIHNGGQPIRFNKRPGRNNYCPCGSGKKFKKCHIDTWDEWLKDYFEKLEKNQKEQKENENSNSE